MSRARIVKKKAKVKRQNDELIACLSRVSVQALGVKTALEQVRQCLGTMMEVLQPLMPTQIPSLSQALQAIGHDPESIGEQIAADRIGKGGSARPFRIRRHKKEKFVKRLRKKASKKKGRKAR